MTVQQKKVQTPYGDYQAYDPSGSSTVQQVVTGSGTLYIIDVDNSSNSAKTYIKLFDATSITLGTTNPDWIFMVPANVRRSFTVPSGFAFSTGLAYALVTTGGAAGTTAPSSTLPLRLIYD